MSQTTAPQTQPVPVTHDKAEAFLLAWGAIVTKGDSKGKTSKKAGVLSSKDDNDVQRRLKRLDQRIKSFETDERFKDVIGDATRDYQSLEGEVATALEQKKSGKKVEWKPIYNKIGSVDATLEKVLQQREKAEEKGRETATEAVALINKIEPLLTSKLLNEEQRKDFAAGLQKVQKGLIAVGFAEGKKRDETKSQVTLSAQDLLDRMQLAIDTNTNLAGPLVQRLEAAMQTLAGLPDDDGDKTDEGEALRQARLRASALLREADGAIAVCGYTAAGTQLTEAEKILAPLKKKSAKPLDADELKTKANALIDTWAKFITANGTKISNSIKQREQNDQDLPQGGKEFYERGKSIAQEAEQQLRSIIFMVTNAPSSAADASVMFANCQKQMAGAMKLVRTAMEKFSEIAKKDLPELSGGDLPTESLVDEEKKLADTISAVESKIDEVRKLATSLYGASSDGVPPGEPVARLEEIEARWTKATDTAFLAAELGADGFLRELAQVQDAIAKKIKAKDAGTFGPADLAFDKATVKYRLAIAALREAATNAMTVNSDKAIEDGLSTRPAVLATDAETLIEQHARKRGTDQDVTNRTLALTNKTTEIEQLTLKAEGIDAAGKKDVIYWRKECAAMSSLYKMQITRGMESLDKKGAGSATGLKGDDRTAAKAYGEALLDEIATIIAPIKTDDVSLLKDMNTALVNFRRRVDAFQALLKPGDGKVLFTAVKKKATKLQGRFDHTLFAPRTEELKPLRDAVDKILANFDKMDPKTAMDQLAELETKINEAQKKAQDEHNEAQQVVAPLLQKARELNLSMSLELSGIGGGGGSSLNMDYQAYFDDISRRAQTTMNEITARDKTTPADGKACDNLIKEIEAAVRGDREACQKGLEAARKKEAAVGEARDNLLKLRQVDLALLRETAKTLSGDAKAALLKQIKEVDGTIGTAIKTLESKRDADAANEMADSVERRIQRLSDAPMGTATSARNKLPDAEKRWTEAVTAMHNALRDLPGKIRESVRDETDPTLKASVESAAVALEKRLGEVNGLFRADAFSSPIKRMTAGSAAPDEVSAAREDGLREARRINKFLAAHPVLRQLVAIPKGYKVDLPFGAVGSALFNMETNLTISG